MTRQRWEAWRRAVSERLKIKPLPGGRWRLVSPRGYRAWLAAVAVVVIVGSIGLYQWLAAYERIPQDLSLGRLSTPNPAGDVQNGRALGTQEPTAEAQAVSANTEQPQAGAVKLRWPVTGKVIQAFGWGYSQTYADYRFHPGVDLETTDSEPVRAAAGGKVTQVVESDLWGWRVAIDHGNGLVTWYSNLGTADVQVGQLVKAGDPLGRAGGHGMAEVAEKPHLHFEVRQAGKAADPVALIGR